MTGRRSNPRTDLVTALLVMAIAVLAAGGLLVIRNVYRQSARINAARSIIDSGRMIAAQLADQPAVRSADGNASDWAGFARLVRSVRRLERNLQYVSVTRKGVTVFHEQLSGVDGGDIPPEHAASAVEPKDVRLGRELLIVGTNRVPVVVFSADVSGGGEPCTVQVAVRREAIERENLAPSGEIARMFKVSLATVFLGFCVCAVIVVLIMHRDARREERRRAEEHLAFSGAIANGIVHDFRNPMSSLKLDVQMLQKEAAKQGEARPGRVAELAARAGSTIDRMDKIFQEFLFLSRPAPETHETIRLNACIKDCLDLLAARFERSGIAVRTELPDADLEVKGHAAALKRALVNVIANAEQFSPKAGSVEVRSFRKNDRAVIEVLDRGPGVPDGEKERIFEMFVTSRAGGTGLGLALARTAVESSNGTIEVENREGGGACFRIDLPLAKA